MSDDSEAKTEEPTKRKLDDARKEGQIAQSRDIVTVTLTISVASYLWFSGDVVSDRFAQLFDVVSGLSANPFDDVIQTALAAGLKIAISIVAPLIIIIIGIVVTTSIIVNKGLLFAVKQITPNFDKVNPAKRLEQLVKPKNLIEAIKSAIKIAVIFVILWIVVRTALDDLLLAPFCGTPCLGTLVKGIFLPFLAAVSILFLFFAFFDHFLQLLLFRREMRMSKTELKRQLKDQEGDPLIKGHRRSLARELVGTGFEDGVAQTTIVINDGFELAVGLRYVPEEETVPRLVTIAFETSAERFMEITAENNIPRVEQGKLAQQLADQGMVGEPVPPDLFDEVGKAIATVSVADGLK